MSPTIITSQKGSTSWLENLTPAPPKKYFNIAPPPVASYLTKLPWFPSQGIIHEAQYLLL
jgi:hypothetical protein